MALGKLIEAIEIFIDSVKLGRENISITTVKDYFKDSFHMIKKHDGRRGCVRLPSRYMHYLAFMVWIMKSRCSSTVLSMSKGWGDEAQCRVIPQTRYLS